MSSHGCNDSDDIDIVDDGWNAHAAYDGRASFLAIEDGIDDWRDITD